MDLGEVCVSNSRWAKKSSGYMTHVHGRTSTFRQKDGIVTSISEDGMRITVAPGPRSKKRLVLSAEVLSRAEGLEPLARALGLSALERIEDEST